MPSKLPPVPYRSQMVDKNGLITPVWSDWFNQAMTRVGGNVADTITELGGETTTADIADDAVTAAKLEDHSSIDANRAVTADHIRTDAVTAPKLAGLIPFAKLLAAEWANDKVSSGYQKLGSGLIVQWGVTASLSSGTTNAISLPLAFPTACLQVVAGIFGNNASATAATGHYGTGNYATAGFDLYNRTSIALFFNWMAVGY